MFIVRFIPVGCDMNRYENYTRINGLQGHLDCEFFNQTNDIVVQEIRQEFAKCNRSGLLAFEQKFKECLGK